MGSELGYTLGTDIAWRRIHGAVRPDRCRLTPTVGISSTWSTSLRRVELVFHDLPGIFSGMKSPPTPEEVMDALGDKVIEALSKAVVATRLDLAEYRKAFPGWVATHTERCLANILHDRMWVHLSEYLDSVPGVSMVDDEPFREIYVGVNHKIRIKRHDDDGLTRSYGTQLALDFQLQRPALPGLEEVHLHAGYVWNTELRDVGEAILSLPDGPRRNHWAELLPPPATPANVTRIPTQPTLPPALPDVEVGGIAESESKDAL